MSCVYEITNIVNGKIYVGASKDGLSRWKEHQRISNRTNLSTDDYFHNSMKKHGISSFKFEIFKEFETDEEAFAAEVTRITELKNLNKQLYNIHPGGNGCYTLTEKQRLSRSERLKGHVVSEEVKKKISETLKNRSLTDEHKENIGKSLSEPMCKQRRSNSMKGKIHTEETKKKIGSAIKHTWQDPDFIAKMKLNHIGSNNSRAILTEDNVKEIKLEWQKQLPTRRGPKGLFYRHFAERFNVSPELICAIIKGRLWKHIDNT